MEIAQGILSRIGEYMVELTVKQGCYLFRFNKIVEDLEEGETKLKSSERRMKEKVEAAVRRTEIIDEDVKTWLNDVRNIHDEVQRLKEEIEAKKSCLSGWFPNCGSRYWLSRKATKKTSIMLKRVDDYGKIETVGRLASLRGIEFSAPEDFEFFQSSRVAFDQIIEALSNDKTYLIGLYGMGGSGKTTLATALGIKVKEERIFDEVAMVVVSQNPDFKDIQSKLASSLGVELKEENEKERANRLYVRFTGIHTETKKKILVILDDVWKKFDLKSKIGFPFGVDNKHCKILLTTRRKDLCIAMRCQPLIPLGLLDEKEGLTLLRTHAGIDDDSFTPELKPWAAEVARECKGLPLAIATVGSALKEKSIDEWKLVCEKLKKSKLVDVSDVFDVDQDVYACLKLSYDYLRDKDTKYCFLLCSLFPEDYEISVEELIVWGMGQGLFSDTNFIEDARSRLRATLNRLKDSCLLLDASRERVKMHDMVRDVALWIASKGNNVFMSKSDVGLMEISGDKDLVQHTAIYLRSHKIEELPANLVCPKLELLFVGGYRRFENLLKVSDECFKEMKGLKVLDLENADLSLKSLEFLTNLKTLKLSNCSLRDISFLGKLNKLEILYLQSSSLDELPRELIELRKLRLLDFDGRASVRIPSNLIRRCSQLEELYISPQWKVEDKSEERSNASLLLELNSLSRLVSLCMRIDATCLPKDFVFPKLLRYNISVNTDICGSIFPRGIYKPSYERSLRISSVEATSLMAFKALYETLEYLYLEKAIGCEYIVPGIDQCGLSKLEYLKLKDCKDLERVLDTSVQHVSNLVIENDLVLLPSLTRIKLENLPQLRSLLKGLIDHVNLQSLKSLHIDSCERLEYVFPISTAGSLGQLEHLVIRKVPQLKQVFFINHGSEEYATERDVKAITLPKLRDLILVGLKSLASFLPEKYHSTWTAFKRIRISNCSCLTSFFYEFKIKDLKEDIGTQKRCGFSQHIDERSHLPDMDQFEADMLKLGDLPQLEYLWKGPTHHVNLQSLKSLRVESCERLEHIFPISIAGSLVQLEQLVIRKVDRLKQVFFMDNQSEENVAGRNEKDMMLPKLQELKLVDLESLTGFSPEGYHVSLPALEVMEISNCSNLIASFIKDQDLKAILDTTSQHVSNLVLLPSLTNIRLERLPQLGSIWKGPTHRANLQNLKSLSIDSCETLEHIFPVSIADNLVQLEELDICEAPQLKQVFFIDHGSEENATERDEKMIMLPKLRKLRLVRLESLTSIFPEKYHSTLTAFKSIKICNCSRLTSFFYEFNIKDRKEDIDTDNTCHFLPYDFGMKENMLELEDLPRLKHIWKGPTHLVNLQSVKSLYIKSCERFEHIFPVSFAESLEQLEKLTIGYSRQLKQVFFMDNQSEENVAGRNGKEIMFPKLQELILVGLESLTNFLPEGYHVSLPALEVVKISKCSNLTASFISQVKMQDQGQNKLKKVRISSCDKLQHIFPISAARGLVQLEELTIEDSHMLKQVFSIDDGSEENVIGRNGKDIILPKLQELRLWCLESLTSFLPEGYHVSLPALKVLQIFKCSNFIAPFISQFKMQDQDQNKLRKVTISSFDKLQHIFPIYVARGLVHLEQLTIEDSPELKQVFSVDDGSEENNVGRNGTDIILPKLRELTLACLTSLTSFLPKSYHVSWPALEVLDIVECPNVSAFFISQVKMQDQKLETLRMGGFEYQTMVQILTCVSLRDLTKLSVTKCNKRRHLFSSTLVQNLSQLEDLTIGDCEDLEQIIFKDDEENHSESEEVLGEKGGVDVMNDKEIVLFPQLERLSLEALPNFTSFCPEGYHLKLNLATLIIKGFQDNQMCFRNLNYLGDVKELCIFDCGVKEIEFGLCKTSTLYIWKCHKLRCIAIPPPTLMQLSGMTIEECDELEEIIIVQDGDDNDEVDIHKDRADDDDDDVTSHHKQLELPDLKWLHLDELGSLAKFCPVNYHFIFPSLQLIIVRGCGKIETRFSYSMGENGSVLVHAEAATKPLKEGSNHDQDAHLPPSEPNLDIACWSRNFASKLPPYIEKMTSKGSTSRAK